jgi:hypothetical protein
VLILLVVERHTAKLAIAILELGWHRWTWGALVSPSAAFCLAVVASSVIWPIYALVFIGWASRQRQWRYATAIVVAVFLLPFVTDFLIWGAFPFTFDSDGVSRVRLIPFIPWPSGQIGEY